MTSTSEEEIRKAISDVLTSGRIGAPIKVSFKGLPVAVQVELHFAGGWQVKYTVVPGMSIEMVRGEDAYLEKVTLTLLKNDGMK